LALLTVTRNFVDPQLSSAAKCFCVMTRPPSGDHLFVDAIKANPLSKAFEVIRPEVDGPAQSEDEPGRWQLRALDLSVLSDDGSGGGFYIVAALQVVPERPVVDCFLDVSFPERINDYAYFIQGDRLIYGYTHRFPGEIIPAIAMDCFGNYEMFYARAAPEIGIDVLKRGLAQCSRKRFIAEDLGYILRDEKRYREAAEMFELVVRGSALVFHLRRTGTTVRAPRRYREAGEILCPV
jgi:hypothetical protein